MAAQTSRTSRSDSTVRAAVDQQAAGAVGEGFAAEAVFQSNRQSSGFASPRPAAHPRRPNHQPPRHHPSHHNQAPSRARRRSPSCTWWPTRQTPGRRSSSAPACTCGERACVARRLDGRSSGRCGGAAGGA